MNKTHRQLRISAVLQADAEQAVPDDPTLRDRLLTRFAAWVEAEGAQAVEPQSLAGATLVVSDDTAPPARLGLLDAAPVGDLVMPEISATADVPPAAAEVTLVQAATAAQPQISALRDPDVDATASGDDNPAQFERLDAIRWLQDLEAQAGITESEPESVVSGSFFHHCRIADDPMPDVDIVAALGRTRPHHAHIKLLLASIKELGLYRPPNNQTLRFFARCLFTHPYEPAPLTIDMKAWLSGRFGPTFTPSVTWLSLVEDDLDLHPVGFIDSAKALSLINWIRVTGSETIFVGPARESRHGTVPWSRLAATQRFRYLTELLRDAVGPTAASVAESLPDELVDQWLRRTTDDPSEALRSLNAVVYHACRARVRTHEQVPSAAGSRTPTKPPELILPPVYAELAQRQRALHDVLKKAWNLDGNDWHMHDTPRAARHPVLPTDWDDFPLRVQDLAAQVSAASISQLPYIEIAQIEATDSTRRTLRRQAEHKLYD